LSGPALAWGPKTQLSIATTALSLISKEANTPLTRLSAEVQQGAGLSDEELIKMFPDYASDPIRAIESEMFLLQAVGSRRIDAYYVYRLGALAKMVSRTVGPLPGADPNFRSIYFADVENAIGRAQLDPGQREIVEPRAYFDRRIREATVNNDVILREYESGVGFKGVASSQLGRDASRSVASVADVWYTILTGASAKGTVSQDHLGRYALDAYAFFIRRNNSSELDAADKRLGELVPKTADMSVQIADLYYQAEMYERAMKEYTAALALAPDRRDVMEKLADYYMHLGQKAEEAEKLEDALDNYAKASDTNKLHPTAEASRLRIAGLIRDREARLAANQGSLQQADGFIALSEQEANDGHYAEAAVLLRQAADTYAVVTDEFALEYQKAQSGQRMVQARLNQIKGALVDNAQSFSGSGFASDARALAQTRGKGLETEALKALIKQEYDRKIAALQERVEPALNGK
jgi:tetratricopeptide (TPR) repeat protein